MTQVLSPPPTILTALNGNAGVGTSWVTKAPLLICWPQHHTSPKLVARQLLWLCNASMPLLLYVCTIGAGVAVLTTVGVSWSVAVALMATVLALVSKLPPLPLLTTLMPV